MRNNIINTTIEGLRTEGLKFSVDTIASKLKISKKKIYKFFPDKEALTYAVYDRRRISRRENYQSSACGYKVSRPYTAATFSVSLVFTGIAVSTLSSVDPSSATVVSGAIAAAAIINEIIAVVPAKYAFKWSGEISE